MVLRKTGVLVLAVAVPLACVLPVARAVGGRHLARSADAGVRLEGVSAASTTDVWAVGSTRGESPQPAILRWDGATLSNVSTNLSSGPGYTVLGELHAVSADSPSDAWAVGNVSPPRTHMDQSLVLRWDGSRWSRVPSPNPSPLANDLKLVKANAPDDVWVAGDYLNPNTHQRSPFFIHWDGSRWSSVHLPADIAKRLQFSGFTSVDPIGPKSVYAIARHVAINGIESDEILHWNGRSWSRAGPFYGAALSGVSAGSGSDVWAVGYNCLLRNCPPFHSATYHWDGRHWKGGVFYKRGDPFTGYEVIPSPGENNSKLVSVVDHTPSDVWATGSCSGPCPHGHVFLLHWNGSAWSRVASPGVSLSSPISSVSGSDAWVIGGGSLRHWDGSSWSRK